MKYIALLRGINVGGNKKVDMKKLKRIFESLGFTHVLTYLNSGNVLFKSDKKLSEIGEIIEKNLLKEFGFEIQTLVKTQQEIKKIADSIPLEWKNDSEEKSDVAYLFNQIDYKEIIDELPIKKDFLKIRYVKGAVFWNVKRKDYTKSNLNKIVGNKFYKFMTVRNVNTARNLANFKEI